MSSQTQPLVHVILPVYNGERYLRECIEALGAQTYRNWQCTIVNNCSKDRSLEIARACAERDSRIRVIDSDTFRGMVANFEYAIALMPPQARYLKFAFCDDQLLPECLQQMVALGESDPEVAIVGCYVTNGTRISSRGIPFGTQVVAGRFAGRCYLLNGESPFESLNALLFRADLIRRRGRLHNYDDGLFEDLDACLDILRESKFGFVHQVLAFNRRDNQSTLSRIKAYNPMLLTDLLFLHRYGRAYLGAAELQRVWDTKTRHYWQFLARSTLGRQDAGFWRFHEDGMQQMSIPFSRARLWWNVAQIILDRLLNPKSTCEKLLAHWRGGRPESAERSDEPADSGSASVQSPPTRRGAS